MADWEEYAEIISRCMDNDDGQLQRVYESNIGIQIDEVIASSALSMAVIELMKFYEDKQKQAIKANTGINLPYGDDKTVRITGLATQLYSELNDIAEFNLKMNTAKIKEWPKASNVLTRRINGIKTNLRQKGIEITIGRDEKGDRIITIQKTMSKEVAEEGNLNDDN
jgi:hypothetical protein